MPIVLFRASPARSCHSLSLADVTNLVKGSPREVCRHAQELFLSPDAQENISSQHEALLVAFSFIVGKDETYGSTFEDRYFFVPVNDISACAIAASRNY